MTSFLRHVPAGDHVFCLVWLPLCCTNCQCCFLVDASHGYLVGKELVILLFVCIVKIVFVMFSLLPGLEVIKLFSSSAQLSMKFQLLINVEIVKIAENSGAKLKN